MGSMKDLLGDVPYVPPYSAFDGETYHAADDYQRLRGQLQRVSVYMADGGWHTLDAIARGVGGTQASVSARLRDLRKKKYGSHEIQRVRVTGGLFEYRLVIHWRAK